MQKDKHTFKRARLYFTSSSVCTFQSDCSALLPPPCQAACFTRSSTLKASTVFAKKKLFKRMYFPLTCISRFVCQHKRTGAGLFCARESVCVFVRSLLGRWCRPAKGPIWLLWGRRRALPRPGSWARYSLSSCCPASTVCLFSSSNTTYLTEKTSRIPPDSPTALPPAGRVCLRVGRIRPKKCLGHRRTSATVNLCEIPACSWSESCSASSPRSSQFSLSCYKSSARLFFFGGAGGFVVNYSFFYCLACFPSMVSHRQLSLWRLFTYLQHIFSDLPTVAAFKVSHLQYNARPCDPIAGLLGLGSKCTLQRVSVSGCVCQRSSRYNWSAITCGK